MIEADIDESAKTLLGRPLYAVAGLFGTREQRRFEDVWSPVIDAAGVDFYHGKDPGCDRLRRPMVSAIRSAGVRGITATAFQDEFAKAGIELKSMLGNHYAFLAVSMGIGGEDSEKQILREKDQEGTVSRFLHCSHRLCTIAVLQERTVEREGPGLEHLLSNRIMWTNERALSMTLRHQGRSN